MPESTTVQPDQRARPRTLRRGLLWAAVLTASAILICSQLQPDALAAVTAVPPWCWFVACLVLGGFGVPAAARWERIVLAGTLILFLILSVEQFHSLGRLVWRSVAGKPRADALQHLRVVTLNCAVGSRQAAAEVRPLAPDIVLLQESPNEAAIRELAHSLFGNEASVVWSRDCTILARGRLQPAIGAATHFAQATLALPDGRTIEVASVRLSPPVVRYDLWNPSCWRRHAAVRRTHRRQAAAVSKALARVPAGRPILLGGDCNSPAGDGALNEWSPRLGDAFGVAGIGWGGTVLNSFPALRFDQLWCSRQMRPLAVWSVKTKHSDHRLVACDFQLAPASPAAVHD